MKTHKWSDVRKRHHTDEELEGLQRQALEELMEADLAALRKMLSLTQTELGERADLSQAQISRLENGGDLLLSSIQRYVEALGGKLELNAVFGDKKVKLLAGGVVAQGATPAPIPPRASRR